MAVEEAARQIVAELGAENVGGFVDKQGGPISSLIQKVGSPHPWALIRRPLPHLLSVVVQQPSPPPRSLRLSVSRSPNSSP